MAYSSQEIENVLDEMEQKKVAQTLYGEIYERVASAIEGYPIAVSYKVLKALTVEAGWQELRRRDLGGLDGFFADELQSAENGSALPEEV